MSLVVAIGLLVSLSVFCLFAAFYGWLRWVNEVQQRLATPALPAVVEPRRRPISEQLNRHLGQTSFAVRVEAQLARANINLTVAEFWLIQGGCALLGLVIGWLLSGLWLSGLVLAILAWLLPTWIVQRRHTRRSKAFADQLPDMLSLLVSSLRAGYGLLHACRVIQQEMPDPMGPEFSQVLTETTLGYSIGDALNHLVERLANEDLELVVSAIHIQNEVGGSLADVLETISETIRERIKLQGELRAMTSQQRMTGWLMTGLPILLGAGMMVLNPDYMMELFKPGWILAVPIGAVVMIIFGNIAMRWVARIEV
jgi:tight adherence protein B